MVDQPTQQNPDFAETMRRLSDDELSFEEVVDGWAKFLDAGSSTPSKAARTGRFEVELDRTLTAIAEQNRSDTIGRQLSEKVSAFPYPTFAVSSSGRIIRMNEAASERFDAIPGQQLDRIGYIVRDGKTPSQLISDRNAKSNSEGDVLLVGATREEDGTSATFAIVQIGLRDGTFPSSLVFVIESTWRRDIEFLVARSYGLTGSESSLLRHFLEGQNLNEIAESTERSIKTLRTQMHMIFQKLEVRSQADLVRKMLTLSHFMQALTPISRIASHPNRRRMDLLRPGARTAEVFFAGDMKGELVVLVPNVTLRTFPAEMEEKFRQRKLCVATLCRPGYGGSDVPAEGISTRDCFAEDFRSLLSQLNVDKVRLLAQNTASGFAVELACDVPEKISELILVSAMPPFPYLKMAKSNAPLFKAFIQARERSPKLFRLLMHICVRAWKMGGVRRTHGRQMAAYPPDLRFLKQPDIMEELDEGMRSRFAQDLDRIAEDFQMAYSDWSEALKACRVPISILHGVHDQAVAIEDVRTMRDEFSDLVTLHEIEDAGFMVAYSHTELFLNALSGNFPD